jgi:hypothetical protein
MGSKALQSALLGLCLLLGGLANTGPIANNDYGLHLRIGAETADRLGPPATDNHSHTLPGVVYRDHEWLTQLLFFGAHRILGDPGMVALKGLLIGLALLLVALSIRGPLAIRLALVMVVLLLGLDHSHMRPHLAGWVLAAGLCVLLQRRKYWALPVLFLAWGNLHGSVLLGVGVACLHLAGEFAEYREKKTLIWMAAVLLVPLMNPYGLRIYTIFFEISGHTGFIGEWKPYTPTTLPFWLLVGLTAGSVTGWVRSRPRNPFDAARVVVLLALAFLSSRNGVVSAIYLAPLFPKWYGEETGRLPGWLLRFTEVLAVAGAVVVLVLRVSAGRALEFRLDHLLLPVAAVEFIQRHHLTGPLYNDYNFGGYLLWKAWPDLPVFIDGRTEVYKGPVLEEYLRISRAEPGWQAAVKRHDIRLFLVRPERSISMALLEHPGWDLVYFDYNAVVYLPAGRAPSIQRLEVVSPYGHRDRSKVDRAIGEMRYLLGQNPLFFGGHKILAYLLFRSGDPEGARLALTEYLRLRPQGIEVEDTRKLVEALKQADAWP